MSEELRGLLEEAISLVEVVFFSPEHYTVELRTSNTTDAEMQNTREKELSTTSSKLSLWNITHPSNMRGAPDLPGSALLSANHMTRNFQAASWAAILGCNKNCTGNVIMHLSRLLTVITRSEWSMEIVGGDIHFTRKV